MEEGRLALSSVSRFGGRLFFVVTAAGSIFCILSRSRLLVGIFMPRFLAITAAGA